MPSILLAGPAAEPITLAEAKQFLRVEHDDDDDIVTALIAGSRIHVETQTRRALITQSWRLTRDVWPASGCLTLLPVPLKTLDAVRVYKSDGATLALDAAGFTLDRSNAPARLSFVHSAPPAPERPAAGIEIDITCGYGDAGTDVPEPLRQAIRLLVAHWYENRGLIAVGSEVAVLPQSVAALIAPYRVLAL
ncbi:MAG: head-tail connector protein [Alphaproteobacteria bacterium]